MGGAYKRYPGAPPFDDDDPSRKVFFGRERESTILCDQIIANRLVVVYARSGVGKTSLLNAGVAQHLRNEGFLPLFARVNVFGKKPLELVSERVSGEAARQGVECVPGLHESLWHFFKTTELWRGDVLLTPVLILDQFEELFTLQTPEFRDGLLNELGYLIRGVRPPVAGEPELARGTPGTKQELTDSPPVVRVVLSLREDFLGFLEEAADAIPQILSQRFRLMPLSVEAARLALQEPSRIDDEVFETRPFDIPHETVEEVLSILSSRAKPPTQREHSETAIEPFQLQLICQRLESLAAERQASGSGKVAVTLKDLGGEQGLQAILKDFYVRVVRSIQSRRIQRAVHTLCENHLISLGGRRLSMEESEIVRVFGLPVDTLRLLVERRLLRAEPHTESVYYELSHDSLVAPILSARRMRRMMLGTASTFLGALVVLYGVLGLVLVVVGIVGAVMAGSFLFTLILFSVVIFQVWILLRGLSVFRSSSENLRRLT